MVPHSPKKPTVLVVDDNRANQLALEAVLGRDCLLLFAWSGPEALTVVRNRTDIDVVLMDVQMPGMDGFEAAERIKQLPDATDLPIIFVTAVHTDDPFVKRGYAVGGVDYFSKPFDPELLKLKVGIYASFRQKGELSRERDRLHHEMEGMLKVRHDLSTLLEEQPAGVLIVDASGGICRITDEASQLLRASPAGESDVHGQLVAWWSAEAQAFKLPGGPLDRALARGESTHSERVVVRCVDGTDKALLASVLPLRSADHASVGAVILIRDVSVARRIEADLAQRVSRLVSEGIEQPAAE